MTAGVFDFGAIKHRVEQLNGRAPSGVAFNELNEPVKDFQPAGIYRENADKFWRMREKLRQAGIGSMIITDDIFDDPDVLEQLNRESDAMVEEYLARTGKSIADLRNELFGGAAI